MEMHETMFIPIQNVIVLLSSVYSNHDKLAVTSTNFSFSSAMYVLGLFIYMATMSSTVISKR